MAAVCQAVNFACSVWNWSTADLRLDARLDCLASFRFSALQLFVGRPIGSPNSCTPGAQLALRCQAMCGCMKCSVETKLPDGIIGAGSELPVAEHRQLV